MIIDPKCNHTMHNLLQYAFLKDGNYDPAKYCLVMYYHSGYRTPDGVIAGALGRASETVTPSVVTSFKDVSVVSNTVDDRNIDHIGKNNHGLTNPDAFPVALVITNNLTYMEKLPNSMRSLNKDSHLVWLLHRGQVTSKIISFYDVTNFGDTLQSLDISLNVKHAGTIANVSILRNRQKLLNINSVVDNHWLDLPNIKSGSSFESPDNNGRLIYQAGGR